MAKVNTHSSYTTSLSLRELTCACDMGSHSVTCHPEEVTFLPLPQPIKARTWFSDPRGMQGSVDVDGLMTYRGGVPARRWSSIPVLTGSTLSNFVRATNDATTTPSHQPVMQDKCCRATWSCKWLVWMTTVCQVRVHWINIKSQLLHRYPTVHTVSY